MTADPPIPGKRSPKAEARCEECRRLESLLRKAELALGDAERQLQGIPGVGSVAVTLVWSPPWTPERIEPRVRAYLGF